MRIARVALAPGEPPPRHPPRDAWDGAFVEIDGDDGHVLDAAPWLGGVRTGAVVPWRERGALPPVEPSKILAIGRNYRAHAAELGNEVPKEPLLFMKPSTSLVGPGGTIVLPQASTKVEHEVELAVVIGRRARAVEVADAMSFVFGYTCANDVTARDLQRSDGQWTRAKGFDTFCPVGPHVVTGIDPSDLAIRCRVDGVVRQDARTSLMVFSIAEMIAYASRIMTLEPGDLFLTGTPAGTGPLLPGNRVEVEIEHVGVLACDVKSS